MLNLIIPSTQKRDAGYPGNIWNYCILGLNRIPHREATSGATGAKGPHLIDSVSVNGNIIFSRMIIWFYTIKTRIIV